VKSERALFESLRRITGLVAEQRDLAATLDEIVTELALVLDVDRCSVMLRCGRDWLRMRGSRGVPAEIAERAVLRLGEGIAGVVADSGEGRLVRNAREQSGHDGPYLSDSAICVPLRLPGEVLGVINVSNKRTAGAGGDFDERDLLVATLLANQAALAIQAAQAREDAQEQARLREANSSLEAQVSSLQQQAAALSVISRVTDAVVSVGTLAEVLPAILRSTTRLLGAMRGSILLLDPGSDVMRIQAAEGLLPDVVRRTRVRLGEGIAGSVARRGEALLIRDASGNRRATGDAPERAQEYRNPSAICVPLRTQGEVLGVLNINDRSDGRDFTEADLFVAQVIANQAALAITNSRLLAASVEAAATRRSLELAREIQQSFLPADPGVAGFRVAGCSDPCDATGGDYIDYAALPGPEGGERLFLAVGDVAGHGVGSALLMATNRALLRALLSQSDDLEDVLRRLNRLVRADLRHGQFMTLFAALADARSGSLIYTGAGHPPPLWVRARGGLVELESSGPPLGVLDEAEFPARRVRLEPGDLIVASTDGAWELRDSRGKSLGRERLAEATQAIGELGPEQVVASLRALCLEFAAGASRSDDLSLVALRYDGVPEPRKPPGEALHRRGWF
jgi:sigma-B regulation protein RsbU (phosphoserine phosphatase)